MKNEKKNKKKTWEFDASLAWELELDAKQLRETEIEWVTKAIKQRLKSKKEYQMLGLKLIPLKCDATCLKCKVRLETGDWAYYGRTGDVICIDCHTLRYGDKPLVYLRMKKLQYKRELKVFLKQIEEYADRLDLYQVADKIMATDKRRNEIQRLVDDFLRTKVGTPEEQQAIENIMRRDEEESQYCHDLERYLGDKMVKYLKKQKKEKKAPYAV